MTQPSPAGELRAAAEKLRTTADAAQAASPLPWTAGGDEGPPIPYIALMHPGVGHALAQWLDDWARPGTTEDDPWPDLHRALAVARAINGSQP